MAKTDIDQPTIKEDLQAQLDFAINKQNDGVNEVGQGQIIDLLNLLARLLPGK